MNGEEHDSLMEALWRMETHLETIAKAVGTLAINQAEDAIIKRLPPELAKAFLHREAPFAAKEVHAIRLGICNDLLQRLRDKGHHDVSDFDFDPTDDPIEAIAHWIDGKVCKESGQ